MALGIDDIVEGAAVPAVLVGVGLAAAAPFLLAGSTKKGRPVAKSLINMYLDMAEKVKEMGSETQEQWKDLLAEVHAERSARLAAAKEAAGSEA